MQGVGVLVDDVSAVAALTGSTDRRVAAALQAGKVVVFHPRELAPDGTVRMNVSRTSPSPDDAGGETVDDTPVSLPAVLVTMPLAPDLPVVPASLLPRLGTDVTATPNGLVASTLAVVGLAAAEGRADVATPAAVGAAPRLRRRLVAAQAGVVAVLGTLLGCASGIVSGATLVLLNRRDDAGSVGPLGGAPQPSTADTWHVVVPWDQLALLAVGLLLLAVVAAAAFTRSQLPLVRRLGQ